MVVVLSNLLRVSVAIELAISAISPMEEIVRTVDASRTSIIVIPDSGESFAFLFITIRPTLCRASTTS